MHLPVQPPLSPMLAKAVSGIPLPEDHPGGLAYEPKWDGFRCIVFRDGDEIELGSRNERPLTRYFPELVQALRAQLPRRCVLDGEIVVSTDGRLSFPLLQERLHPAKTRVDMLAARNPASYIAFDLLAIDDSSLLDQPFAHRREALTTTLRASSPPLHLTPLTLDPSVAAHWFTWVEGAGLDGLVAKAMTLRYLPDQRVMLKVKHARTADVVVAGYRLHKASTDGRPLLGSLLLGLHDAEGRLQHVGVAAAFPMARRADLHEQLQPLVADLADHPWGQWAEHDASTTTRRPGAVSRWNTGKDLSFVPLRPDLVCEVGYDAMEGSRFRHTAQFRRWRPDRVPASCTYEQLERPVSVSLAEVLAAADSTGKDGMASHEGGT